MTYIYIGELHELGSDDPDLRPVAASSETRLLYRKLLSIQHHRHTRERERLFFLRPREQQKP